MPPRKKASAAPPPQDRPALKSSRPDLEGRLDERVAAGEDLVQRLGQVHTKPDFQALQRKKYSWSEFNFELLRRAATTDELAEGCQVKHYVFSDPTPQSVTEDVQEEIRLLLSLKDRLPLIDEAQPQLAADTTPREESTAGREVFIVHGQRQDLKQAVARFIQQGTGREAVILHEQPSAGQTVIEKFERHASDAGFAVVLLTADDQGGPLHGELQPRGRQNVIFEAGFFIGALGRSRVAILFEEGIGLPSDLNGVIWIPVDHADAWKFHLAKELRAGQIAVDMNKVL